MAIDPDIIAQRTPAAGGGFEVAYTVPALTATTISTIILHNTDPTTTDDGRVRIADNGAANAATQQIVNVNIPPDGSVVITTGVTLAATDVVRVASTNGTLNFHFYGIVET
jgi:hypothetical protein